MSPVASCNLNSPLKCLTSLSVSEALDLLFKDCVLQLAASARPGVVC